MQSGSEPPRFSMLREWCRRRVEDIEARARDWLDAFCVAAFQVFMCNLPHATEVARLAGFDERSGCLLAFVMLCANGDPVAERIVSTRPFKSAIAALFGVNAGSGREWCRRLVESVLERLRGEDREYAEAVYRVVFAKPVWTREALENLIESMERLSSLLGRLMASGGGERVLPREAKGW